MERDPLEPAADATTETGGARGVLGPGSVPLGGGGGAPGADDGYISASDAAPHHRGRLSDGGEGAGGEGDREAAAERAAILAEAILRPVLRPLPPSPWEERARDRDREAVFPVRDDWEDLLVRGDKGGLVKSVRNLMLILRNDPRWSERLRFNTLTQAPELDGRALTDSDLLHARGVVERDYHLSVGEDLVRSALRLAAEYLPHDPRREYLAGLSWDGVERIDTIAERHFGWSSELAPRMLGAFFVGAVRRVFEPGCKHDTMLILLGSQGYRKSTFFDALSSPWFCDSRVELGSRDGQLVASGQWIIELAEVDKDLAGKADDALVKSVLTSRQDTFRRPYASQPETVPRSSIYVGTTNRRAILRDLTGSRRFHVVEVHRPISAEAIAAERDQLWAEAVYRYRLGVRYWLTDEEEAARETAAARYRRADPWADLVRAYLLDHTNLTPVQPRKGVARYAVPVVDLLGKALGLEKREQRARAGELAETMESLGAERGHAKVTRGAGLSALKVTEHVYFLPAEFVPNNRRLADGSEAPTAVDSDADEVAAPVVPPDPDDFPT